MFHPRISADCRFTTYLAGERRALQLALGGAPLADTLQVLLCSAESQALHRFAAAILLLDADGRLLRLGAAPALPGAIQESLDGCEPGPSAIPCGRAAHYGHAILCADIARDEPRAGFRDLMLAHGLRACWSTPLVATRGKVQGTLALYYRERGGPTEEDREIVRLVGNTAALIVESARADERTARAAAALPAHATWTLERTKTACLRFLAA